MNSLRARSSVLCTALAAAMVLLWLAGAGCVPGPQTEPGAAYPFANVDNTPFATRTNGPRGAVLYEPRTDAPADLGTALDATVRVASAKSGEPFAAENAFVDLLKRYGLKAPGVMFRPNRRAVPVRAGAVLHPSLRQARVRQTGDLSFVFDGWPDDQRALLDSIATKAYPICVHYYGYPAFPHPVTVKLDPAISSFAEGVYDAGTDTIRLAPLSDNAQNTEFALIRHILHAMRDDAMLSYDAWEEGQVLAVTNQVMAEIEQGWDPTLARSEYSLNLYELMNQPELGSDAIWNTGFGGLVVPRLALSSGAWLKVLVEDPLAIAKFNAAYYPGFAADPSLAGDVPHLTALMAGIVPQVEGRGFWDWFRSQYALDTSEPIGERVYAGMVPTFDAVALYLTHTLVGQDGTERGAGGLATLDFWDYTHQFSLFVQEGYQIPIPSTGTTAGIGEYSGSLANIGGQQRITVDVVLGPAVRHLIYPYNSRREDLDYQADPNGVNLYGAMVGRDEGSVAVSVNGGEDQTLTLTNGAFREHVGDGLLKPGKLKFTYTDPAGVKLERVYNTGYFDYAIVDTVGVRAQLSHTFLSGASGLRLISFPGQPVVTDEALVLGLDPTKVLLALWQADASGDPKYRIYPDIPTIRPGVGYWLKSSDPVTVAVGGDNLATLGTYRIPLSPGWNLVGVPADSNVALDNLRLDRGGASVPFSQAVQSGWVRSVVFEFDPTAGSYVEALGFEPWSAYWVRCIVAGGCNLVFFEPAKTTALSIGRGPSALPPSVADRLRAAGADVAELRVSQGATTVAVVLATLPSAGPGIDAEWDAEAPPAAPGSSLRAGVERDGDVFAVDADATAERRLTADGLDSGEPITLAVLSGSVRLLAADGSSARLGAGERVQARPPGPRIEWRLVVSP